MTDEGPDKIAQLPRRAKEPSQATNGQENAQQPSTALSLPSGNISHSITLENEMQSRLHQFKAAILTITQEMDGQQKIYEAAVKELTDKHNVAKTDLLRRLTDLQRGERSVSRALDSLAEPDQS